METHPHHIDKLPGADTDSRREWIERSKSLTLRALASDDACDAIGLDLLLEHAGSHIAQEADHSWRSDNNALLALLSGQQNFFLIQGSTKDKEHWALNEKVVDAARDLVKMGYDPLQTSSVLDGADALDYALMLNAPGLVAEWAPGAGDLSQRTMEGLPWIHAAAASGMREMTKLLASLGMDPNMRDKKGNTPLFYATNPGMVSCLRELGADTGLRNDNKIDALTFMRSGRNRIEGEQLSVMTRAMGERKAPDDLEIIVAQFEVLAKTGGGGALLKEAQSINLPANTRFPNGQTILGQALTRFSPNLNYRVASKDRTKASGWVSACTQWADAMRHATSEDVATLWVFGHVSGHEKWVQGAKSELKRRGIDPAPLRQEAATVATQALMDEEKSAAHRPTKRMSKDQTERLIHNMLAGPDFGRPDQLVWALSLINHQGACPPADLAHALSQQKEDWEGWKKPELIKELTVSTLSFTSDKAAEAEDYAQLVGTCLKRGGKIGHYLQTILDDYSNSYHMPMLAAQIEKASISSNTPEAEGARKGGPRL